MANKNSNQHYHNEDPVKIDFFHCENVPDLIDWLTRTDGECVALAGDFPQWCSDAGLTTWETSEGLKNITFVDITHLMNEHYLAENTTELYRIVLEDINDG